MLRNVVKFYTMLQMLTKLTIEEIGALVKKKEISLLQLNEAYEINFNKYKELNAHIAQCWESAKDQAKFIDTLEEKHPLAGIPISIKDMFLTKGIRTTAASKILENFVAPYESFVTQRLKNSGYTMPFKTNLDEFAMGSSSETSAFGPVISPWILKDGVKRVPGGSSGGSAVSVAACMSLGSLGTDTGGSVRQPAAFCGIVGLKPTYGRCSRRGIIAFASSLDHPGIFAKTVQDACIIFETIAGYDAGEATSLNLPVPELSKVKGNVHGKRIGIVPDIYKNLPESYQEIIEALIEKLKDEGAYIEEIQVPSLDMALELYYVIAPAEAASNLARYDGIRFGEQGSGENFEEILQNTRALFGKEVKRRILIGNFVLAANEYEKYYGKAYKLRLELKRKMNQIFQNVDAILLPTSPNVAFPLGESRAPVDMYYEDLYTIIANIYGGPTIQVPIGKLQDSEKTQNTNSQIPNYLKIQDGLPVGVQIMGAMVREDIVVAIAKKIEEMVEWKGLEC